MTAVNIFLIFMKKNTEQRQIRAKIKTYGSLNYKLICEYKGVGLCVALSRVNKRGLVWQ